MSQNCVCGGSTANPNMDCERCQLIAKLAAETKGRTNAEARVARLEEGIWKLHEQTSTHKYPGINTDFITAELTALLSAGEEAKDASVS